MHFTLYRLRLKCLCKNYNLLVLLYIFPIFISTLFYLGFYNTALDNNKSINLSFIKDTDYFDLYEYFEEINYNNKEAQFNLVLNNKVEANELLKAGTIDGYIEFEESKDTSKDRKPILFMIEDGIKQTTIKFYLDMYESNHMVNLLDKVNYVSILPSYNENKDYTLAFFYTMVALICLLGAKLGFKEMDDFHSDESYVGKRVLVSSLKTRRLLLSNLGALFTLHLGSILLLLIFYIQVLNVINREHLFLLFSLCLIGSILGISLGAFIHVFIKLNKTIKRGIINVIIFTSSFAAGFIFIDLKYFIMNNFPLVNLLNPASLIADALYYLYILEDYNRVLRNLLVLLVWCVVLSVVAFVPIRRNHYASN